MLFRFFRRLRPILCLGLGLALAGTCAAEPITVFAAASLKSTLDEISGAYEEETGRRIVASYAGTSALARQIEAGAPADVFISANPDWMDRLGSLGLIVAGTRVDLLGNRLVLVAHGSVCSSSEIDGHFDIAARLGDGRLAMALVDAVPAGIYGKAALTSLGLWDDVARQIAQTDNVRAALALVATGEAPLGVVYATDAAVEPRTCVAGIFPETSHPPIRYPAAAVAGADLPGASAYLAFLRGAAARAAFERLGFSALDG